jgi:two-component system, chemotaxis family, chemotaxis protein CheY
MEPKIRVLAVDDSKVSLLTVRRNLAGSEFELTATVQHGREALACYQEVKPEVTLLDVVMPDMDGVTLLEQLRAHDPEARIIMVSSLGTREKITECLAKGAANFLIKPYDREGLLTALRAVRTSP